MFMVFHHMMKSRNGAAKSNVEMFIVMEYYEHFYLFSVLVTISIIAEQSPLVYIHNVNFEKLMLFSHFCRQDHMNKYVYVNGPSSDYFAQFNTSSR